MLLSFVKLFKFHDPMVETFVFKEKGNIPSCVMTMNDIESGNCKINDNYLFLEIDKYAIRFRSCRNMKIACNLHFPPATNHRKCMIVILSHHACILLHLFCKRLNNFDLDNIYSEEAAAHDKFKKVNAVKKNVKNVI